MNTTIRFGAVVALGLMAACQDATEPFDPLDRTDVGGVVPVQLTFSPGDDRSPAWTPRGDTVMYATEGFAPFSTAPGVLLSVPAGGGAARSVLPELQFPGALSTRFAQPTPSPDGSAVAWSEMWGIREDELCRGTSVQCSTGEPLDGRQPRLGEVRIRVRARGSEGDAATDPLLRVVFEGVETVPWPGGPLPFFFRIHDHPFHRLFDLEGSLVFRFSWSPDGSSIAYSDGLQILTWSVGSAEPVPIAGTDDGVSAAWSPDGAWIAFSRLIRGEPIQATCSHFTLGLTCFQERTIHPVVDRVLTLVRPGGSEFVELGTGEEPAWLPDSSGLVYLRNNQLWRVSVTGGGAVAIAGTDDAREPAVSPDGSQVAVARLSEDGKQHDIWVLPLGGGS